MSKKVAMIIAFREFRDEEYFITKKTLERAGLEITTVSDSLGRAIGKLGNEAEVDILLDSLEVEDYCAVLFIGGPGAAKYMDDQRALDIVQEAVDLNKVLGAICIAPIILAKAGVLEGKKATVWSSILDKSAVKILKQAGADYQEQPVVVDGNLVTASGPLAAEDFAQSVISAIAR